MPKHWSADMFVLCWSDINSNMRMRMSWHKTRERLERMASMMPKEADPILYDGLSQRLTIKPWAPPEPKVPKTRKPKTKRSKKPEAAAA